MLELVVLVTLAGIGYMLSQETKPTQVGYRLLRYRIQAEAGK